MKLLIIEDEKELLSSVRSYMESEGFVCEVASDFDSANELISLYAFDCIIVDLTLPGGTGMDLVRNIKANTPATGIIIISAKNSLDDKLQGLELGSDDYLTKPFHLSELNARVKALLRRRNFNGNNISVFNDLKIDPGNHMAWIRDQLLPLTKKEFDLLLYFVSNRGKVLTKEAIAEHLWGNNIDQADSFDFIYSHIKNLRKKIAEAGGADPVQTIYGLGYKFVILESA